MSTNYAYILVDSTSHALKLEKVLGQSQLTCKLVPVPRQLSSDCGVCLRVLRADLPAIREALAAFRADYQSIEEA